MALDVNELMAFRAKKERKPNSREDNKKQIQMFEDIEEGNKCLCPAFIGNYFLSISSHKIK